jgi:hypothetical protein
MKSGGIKLDSVFSGLKVMKNDGTGCHSMNPSQKRVL